MYVFRDFACHRPAAGRWMVGGRLVISGIFRLFLYHPPITLHVTIQVEYYSIKT